MMFFSESLVRLRIAKKKFLWSIGKMRSKCPRHEALSKFVFYFFWKKATRCSSRWRSSIVILFIALIKLCKLDGQIHLVYMFHVRGAHSQNDKYQQAVDILCKSFQISLYRYVYINYNDIISLNRLIIIKYV